MILDALVSTPKRRSLATFSPFLLILGSMSFRTHAANLFTPLVAPEKRYFLSNWTLLDSTKNWGRRDFWTQLLRVSCLDPAVEFYPLFMHFLWEEHQLGRFPELTTSAKHYFLLNRMILDSTKNWGTWDSPTYYFWTQLIWVSCLDPTVRFYPLLLHIIWEEHQLVGSLHWWRRKSSPFYQTVPFCIWPKI